MDKKTVVIVGAGPGMGIHLAAEFGAKGFRTVLMARRRDHLDSYVAELTNIGIEAHGFEADAAKSESLTSAFNNVEREFGRTDILVYNACVLEGGKPSALSAKKLLGHYQVDVANALHCVHMVLPGMRKMGNGAILFTGGGFALNPMPEFASISMHKAALRALAIMLHAELKDENIFAGIVTITGQIMKNTEFDPAVIAKEYWKLYTERNRAEIIYK